MPIAPDEVSGAAAAARHEAGEWAAVAGHARRVGGIDPPPTELAVVRFHDPAEDLDRRSALWNHRLESHDLAALARFAAGLAAAEADAWEGEARDVALAAFTERRYLVADRLIHWAVPWLYAVATEDPSATPALRRLLELGDVLRPAPRQARGEGVHPPGEDSYGPVDLPVDDRLLRSVWSGVVWVRANRPAAGPRSEPSAGAYRSWSRRWTDLAAAHEGTAGLWLDLAARAERTAHHLGEKEKA